MCVHKIETVHTRTRLIEETRNQKSIPVTLLLSWVGYFKNTHNLLYYLHLKNIVTDHMSQSSKYTVFKTKYIGLRGEDD